MSEPTEAMEQESSTKTIHTLSEFIEALEAFKNRDDGTEFRDCEFFYRGHSDRTYQLTPSIFRNEGHRDNETLLLQRLTTRSPAEFQHDRLAFEKLARAQHYRLPTRLLDFSSNPLTALYFACDGVSDAAGQVRSLKVLPSQVKFFDSDTVSCKSNLAFLSEDERNKLKKHGQLIRDAPEYRRWKKSGFVRDSSDYEEVIRQFNDNPITRRLVQFIRIEKPYFRNQIEPKDLVNVSIVMPKASNKRLEAQRGVFIIFGLKTKITPVQAPQIGQHIIEHVIDIPAEAKRQLINQLRPSVLMRAPYIRSWIRSPQLSRVATGGCRRSGFSPPYGSKNVSRRERSSALRDRHRRPYIILNILEISMKSFLMKIVTRRFAKRL